MKRLILVITLSLLACAPTQYNLKPIAYKQSSRSYFSNDREILFCEGQETNILLFAFRDNSEIFIYPFIVNKSTDKYIDILPEKIKAFGVNKSGKSKELKVYSAQEYINKKQNEQKWTEFFVALSGAVNSMNAAKSTTYSSGYSNLRGNVGGLNYYGNAYSNYTTTTYDYNKSLEAQERTKRDLTELRTKHNSENQFYNNVLLKKNTIPPSYSIEGYIILKGMEFYHSKYAIILPAGVDKYKIILKPALNK